MGIVKIPDENIPIAIATKMPMRLEKSTKPPEPRLPVEYFETRYWSETFTNAHKNGAPKAIKNHCIIAFYHKIKARKRFLRGFEHDGARISGFFKLQKIRTGKNLFLAFILAQKADHEN
jgi:hypothetical protein